MQREVLLIHKVVEAREILLTLLQKKHLRTTSVDNPSSALHYLQEQNFDIILTDTPLKWATKIPTILIDTPLNLSHLEQSLSQYTTLPKVIAESPLMRELIERAKHLARSHANVFISGESGTGKEVIASLIHHYSPRAGHPFVKVNCAALPDTLIESEFFGHEKGAFTGALSRRIGRFELADTGTLLLDEISEIPPHLQAKLLRVVQEQEFERLGGTTPLKVNVRLISTSNRNMSTSLKEGLFREDLYYRLNVVPLHLPPLRERPQDILPLAHHFLTLAAYKNNLPIPPLSLALEKQLLLHPWPGNARELMNAMEQYVVIGDMHLTEPTSQHPYSPHLTLHEVEREHILQTLAAHQGNKTQAAKSLGITTRTLRNKLNAF